MIENKYLHKTHSFPSPAKLNLFLHIVARREDGYHELETLFQFLDFGDTLTITVTNQNKLNLLTPIVGVDNEDNLIIKAARLLRTKILLDNPFAIIGADIQVNKILPLGGGLGGGSSNAATTLLALNKLWQSHYPISTLATLGLTLGADVPIFIHGFAAFAQGIGEKLTPVQPIENWYLVTKPDCSISTKNVFVAHDLTRDTKKISTELLSSEAFNSQLFGELFHNDCQTHVIKNYPEVAKLLAWLLEYAPSRMTGTGACIFSSFSSLKQAQELQKMLPQGIYSFVAKGVNKSPLLGAIDIL